MKANHIITWIFVCVVALFLSACASLPCGNGSPVDVVVVETPEPEPPPPPPPVPEPEVAPEPETPWVEGGVDEQGETIITIPGADGNPLSITFNFEFDQSDIASGDFRRLQAFANALSSDPNASAVVQGHCDERGTREYNLALGERRADAVVDFLKSAGVPERQLDSVSYGEEVPLNNASTEEAWAENRRAVIKITRSR